MLPAGYSTNWKFSPINVDGPMLSAIQLMVLNQATFSEVHDIEYCEALILSFSAWLTLRQPFGLTAGSDEGSATLIHGIEGVYLSMGVEFGMFSGTEEVFLHDCCEKNWLKKALHFKKKCFHWSSIPGDDAHAIIEMSFLVFTRICFTS